MNRKRFTSLLLSMVLVSTAFAVNAPVYAEKLTEEKVGKCVEFGKYYQNPVQYIIGGSRDVDGDGVNELFLYSKKLISFKEWNASGIADWRDSTLRTWLNSTDENVKYEDDNIPSYAAQKGFLAHFTDAELGIIVPETHKTLILNQLGADGGSNDIGWNDRWPDCYTNAVGDYDINTAYHVVTNDSVFIPSIADMYMYNMGLDGGMSDVDGMCLFASGEKANDGTVNVWVRDGSAQDSARFWYPANSITVASVKDKKGIRPCFYIKSNIECTGSGTTNSPYRLKIPTNVSKITLSDMGEPTNWGNGPKCVDVTFSENAEEQPITVLAIRYENDGEKTKIASVSREDCILIPDSEVNVSVNIENASTSFMKVLVFDKNGKSLCSAKTFGNCPNRSMSSSTGEGEFYATVNAEGTKITISGAEKNRPYSKVSVLVTQGDKKETILFADQVQVDNGYFCFDIDQDKAFGENAIVGGWYNVVISSDYEEKPISTKVGLAGDSIYRQVLDLINDGEKEKVEKILSKDDDFILQFTSLYGRDLSLDLLETVGTPKLVAERLISDKPVDGYDEVNFKEIFNKIACECAFDCVDTKTKFKMLENSKYEKYFNCANIISKKTYDIVKGCNNSNKLFDNVKGIEINKKLQEALVVTGASIAENATQLMTIVEENANEIGIVFDSRYYSLAPAKQKKLYDGMLYKNYRIYYEIKNEFSNAFNEVTKITNSGGGGGGGKSSSYNPPIISIKADAVTTENVSNTIKFDDVENLTWGKTEINALVEKGIIKGISKSKFGPNDSITREQFCQLAVATFGISNSSLQIGFSDVVGDAWYASAVRTLANAGYISGISNNKFGVGNDITRQDLAVIIYRIIRDKLPAANELKFSDKNHISNYARDAVATLVAAKIINGYDDNSFGAQNKVTRREAAVMLYQALNAVR